MTPDLLQDFGAAIEQIKADPEVRCVIITGKGSSFCAGADFRNRASTADTERFMSPWEKSLYNTYGHFAKVLDIEVPTIAAMNGHAIGGGLGLALVCDMRVANSQSQYGANFTKLGLHPGMATTYILPRLVGMPKAMELIYTGRIMKGDEAAELGLANHSCDGADDVLAKAQVRGQPASLLTGLRCAHTDGAVFQEIASTIAGNAPLAVRWSKISLTQNVPFDPRAALLLEAHMQSRTGETADQKEGIRALLEKRDPTFKGE